MINYLLVCLQLELLYAFNPIQKENIISVSCVENKAIYSRESKAHSQGDLRESPQKFETELCPIQGIIFLSSFYIFFSFSAYFDLPEIITIRADLLMSQISRL